MIKWVNRVRVIRSNAQTRTKVKIKYENRWIVELVNASVTAVLKIWRWHRLTHISQDSIRTRNMNFSSFYTKYHIRDLYSEKIFSMDISNNFPVRDFFFFFLNSSNNKIIENKNSFEILVSKLWKKEKILLLTYFWEGKNIYIHCKEKI